MNSIAETIKTPRNHSASRPFGAKQMIKVPLDADKLEIVNDPLPKGRVHHGRKYDVLFANLKPGSAVRIQSDDVQKISNALRKHITDKGLNAHVRSVLHYPGDPQDFGRVWMMPGPQTVPCSGYRKARGAA